MQDKHNGEQVLVFKRSLLDALGRFQGTTTNVNHYLGAIFDKPNAYFYPRFIAERDETFKQIIPYVVFRYQDEVFSYVRGKQVGETRLVGERSIGIGGHVNPCDDVQSTTPATAYRRAVMREIHEEVYLPVSREILPHELSGCFVRTIALINDDSNAVGRVHFGIVHLYTLMSRCVSSKEDQIVESGFIPIAELAGPRRSELENWSRLCVDLLTEKEP